MLVMRSLWLDMLSRPGAAQGPAVWALRAQTDKLEYAREMRRVLERTPNLDIREGMAIDLEFGPNDEVTGSQPSAYLLHCIAELLCILSLVPKLVSKLPVHPPSDVASMTGQVVVSVYLCSA